jgi:SNF2 family DNA or RNA helicase
MPEVNATLREYQKQGVRWIAYLYKHKLGGCLADDMGLGKTIQTIALLASIYPEQQQPTLIVMPKTLLFNWESELKRFAPKLTSALYYGQTRDIKTMDSPNIILTTYAMVRNDIEQLKEEHFHMVVLDESQNIKNPNSKTSRAVMLLQTDHRFALSGTPIENNMSELYALFRFLNPAMFGTFSDFSKNYLNPIQKNDNKTVAKELKKKIYPFVLRRLKTQVLKDLPDKMEQVLHVDMSREQAALYHQRRLMYKRAIQEEIQAKGLKKSKLFILQAMGELRQIASIPEIKSDNKIISPKREILMEHVSDAVAGKHKVLVFANYLHSLECVSQDMEDAGIHHLVMTGASRDRNHIVEQFQEDDSCQALLMTLKTGGLGLNLTAAEYVFLFDPWWNLAAENQAIDRAHRMGQKNTVFSYRLIARNTIEEKILMLQEKKKALFDSLIASDNASIKQMEEEDIDLLLGE